MWKLLQIAVFVGVMFSSIYYGWREGVSMLAVSVVALFAALMVTALIAAGIDLVSRFRGAGQHRVHSRARRPAG
jgi:hypothetical protein